MAAVERRLLTYAHSVSRSVPRTRPPGRRAVFWILVMAIAGLMLNAIERVPQNWKTVAHVHLKERPAPWANWQLNILAFAPKTCLSALSQANIAYKTIAYQAPKDGCGIDNGVTVQKLTARFSSPIESTCALTAALAWWEESLDKDAMATMGAHIARVDHVGTYACRNVNGAAEGPRSTHASANAIDVTGFHFVNGKTATVKRDWAQPTPEGRFLALARADACRFFNAVLSPDYNALHHDHFHLDLGFWRACR